MKTEVAEVVFLCQSRKHISKKSTRPIFKTKVIAMAGYEQNPKNLNEDQKKKQFLDTCYWNEN